MKSGNRIRKQSTGAEQNTTPYLPPLIRYKQVPERGGEGGKEENTPKTSSHQVSIAPLSPGTSFTAHRRPLGWTIPLLPKEPRFAGCHHLPTNNNQLLNKSLEQRCKPKISHISAPSPRHPPKRGKQDTSPSPPIASHPQPRPLPLLQKAKLG